MAIRILRTMLPLFVIALCLVGCSAKSAEEDVVSVSTAAELTEVRQTQAEESKSPLSPLSEMSLTLPDGISSVSVSGSQIDFMSGTQRVGGILILECDPAIFEDVLGFPSILEEIVNDALAPLGLPSAEWTMSGGSKYGIEEYSRGSETSEYKTHVLRGNQATYAVWLDKKQVSDSQEIEIMTGIHSDDIVDSLNRITTEDFMNAISKEMEKHTYQFTVDLPSQLHMEQVGDDGAVFLQNGNIVGGYKVIHFEKGILPKVHENRDIVLQRIVDDLSAQIALDEYQGEIIADMPITLRFTNQGAENTHYILSYGQIGTQYDLWLDSKALDEKTIDQIVQNARLVKVSDSE